MTIVPTTIRSMALTVDDKFNTTTATLTLTGYSSEVLSTNVILYYNVEAMAKIVSQAISYTILGNVVSGSISGVMKI